MFNRKGQVSGKMLGFFVVNLMVIGIMGLAFAQEELSDTEISNAVNDELMDDPATPAWNIDVSTSQGIVTLDGSVNNILAKDRAEKIAATVKGIRGIVNRIEVEAPYRSDTEISEDVRDSLLWNAATESWEISTSVDEGIVTLTGTVDSWQEKQLAAKVVKGVRGVQGIDNNIQVAYETERSDIEIQNEIDQALRWDAYVDDTLIDVSVDDNEVSLSGTVGSYAEKLEAGNEAWVSGVTGVENNLEVAYWARDERLRKDKYVDMLDSEIKDAINDAYLYDPRVNMFDITVDPDGGYVTLRGTVDNLKAKRVAAQDARNVVGVWSVDNRIKVRPGTPSDSQIEENVEDALDSDPYVEQFEITVSVVDGEVYLYGDVGSYFEKARADDIAATQVGVRKVNNFLTVNSYERDFYDPYVDDWYTYDYDWYETVEVDTGKSDWEIREDIKDELFWSPFVDSDKVNVEVDNGEATLTGTVETWQERQAATENAFEGGAVTVDNDLNVEYGPEYYYP